MKKNGCLEMLKDRLNSEIVGMEMTCINCEKEITKGSSAGNTRINTGKLVSKGKVICPECGCNAFSVVSLVKVELVELPEEEKEEEK